MVIQIRYVQSHDKDTWIPHSEKVDAGNLPLFINHPNARHTMLGVGSAFMSKMHPKPVQSGWMWIDIDHKDLSVALKSAQDLVGKLRKYGLADNDIRIALSGSKGVHIYLSPHLFYDGSEMFELCYVYRHIAKAWNVTGLDLQIFNEGMGRPVRPDNSKRPDGKWKVPITVKELLEDVTSENYGEWVSKPRDEIPFAQPKLNIKLSLLFTEAASFVAQNPQGLIIPEPDAANMDEANIDVEEIPSCVTLLASLGKVVEDVTFDRASYPIGVFLAKTNLSEVNKHHITSSFCRTFPKHGGTHQGRINELEGVTERCTKKSHSIGPSWCGVMRGILSENPSCQTCKLVTTSLPIATGESKAEDEKIKEKISLAWMTTSRLQELDRGYFTKPVGDSSKILQVTTFLMKRLGSIVRESDEDRVAFYTVELHVPGFNQTYTIEMFPAEAFNSKAEFKKSISGYPGVSFLGTDLDVTSLKQHLDGKEYAQRGGVPSVTITDVIGLQVAWQGSLNNGAGDYVNTWVEPKFSTGSMGSAQGYKYVGGEGTYPALKKVPNNRPITKQAWRGLMGITKMNDTSTMSILLGYMLYTHISQHLAAKIEKIGSISIYGAAESGKSQTMRVLMTLTGQSYSDANKTLSPAGTTALPYVKALTGRGFPTVLNEVQPKSMGYERYQYVIELIKSLYDCGVVRKGSIRGGSGQGQGSRDSTVVNEEKLRSPAILLSEEPISGETVQAVLDRLIPIGLTKENLDAHKDAFLAYEDSFEHLEGLGKALIHSAIYTNATSVYDMFKMVKLPAETLDSPMSERRQSVYRMVLLGYVWGLKELARLGAPEDVIRAIGSLETQLITNLGDINWVKKAAKRVTELEQFLETIGTLAKRGNLESKDNGEVLTDRKEYAVEGDLLILDLKQIFIKYSRHQRSVGATTAYKTHASLNSAVKASPFYMSEGYSGKVSALQGQHTILISLSRMSLNEIETKDFLNAY